MRPTKYKLVTIVLLAVIFILVLDWVSEPGEQAEGINAPTIVPAPLESPWTPWTLGPTIEERVSALEERAEQEQYRKFLREARR